jgi:hypothetical protein
MFDLLGKLGRLKSIEVCSNLNEHFGMCVLCLCSVSCVVLSYY